MMAAIEAARGRSDFLSANRPIDAAEEKKPEQSEEEEKPEQPVEQPGDENLERNAKSNTGSYCFATPKIKTEKMTPACHPQQDSRASTKTRTSLQPVHRKAIWGRLGR
jgi:hypothetical protein